MRHFLLSSLSWVFLLFLVSGLFNSVLAVDASRWWQIQSVDTMKYSRDKAREMGDSKEFEKVISRQVKDIAGIGATHIAIDTPYDAEFRPFQKKWLAEARANGLKVWFRGNWAGWEKIFDYSLITRAEHISKTYDYIVGNPELFEDGDIFDFCPECENGGPGDPRKSGDYSGHRQFLIDSSKSAQEAFSKIKKLVRTNINSASGDLAIRMFDTNLVKDHNLIITLDHYVKDYDQLIKDIDDLHRKTGGQIVLGEVGVPIPDIHAQMTEDERSAWLEGLLEQLTTRREYVMGLNYWVSVGGSTYLWDNDGVPEKIAFTLAKYFKPHQVIYKVTNGDTGETVPGIPVMWVNGLYVTDSKGEVVLPLPPTGVAMSEAIVYGDHKNFARTSFTPVRDSGISDIELFPQKPNLWDSIKAFISGIFHR